MRAKTSAVNWKLGSGFGGGNSRDGGIREQASASQSSAVDADRCTATFGRRGAATLHQMVPAAPIVVEIGAL